MVTHKTDLPVLTLHYLWIMKSWRDIGLVIGYAMGIVLLLGLLGGCSWFGPQPGMTTLRVDSDGSVKFENGKEYEEISGKFSRPDGLQGEFRATKVKAFEGQAIAAAMQLKQMEMLEKLIGLLVARTGRAAAP